MRANRIAGGLLALAVASGSALPANAEDLAATAARFGALEMVQDISLSPDGTKIMFLAPMGASGRQVFMADTVAGGAPQRIVTATNAGETLDWCAFATDSRLVCQVSATLNDAGVLVGFTRLIAMDANGKNIKPIATGESSRSLGYVQSGGSIIDWDAGKPGNVLMTRNYVPEETIGTRLGRSSDGMGVVSYDLEKMTFSVVEQPKPYAVSYVSDGKGTVRLMGSQLSDMNGYNRNKLTWMFRKPGSRGWDALTSVNVTGDDKGFWPVAVDSAKNVAYAYADQGGRDALITVSLDGQATRQVLLSRSDVDVDGLIKIGRDHRVVGATFATERRQIEFFDPELKKLGAALGKALPGKPTIDFVGSSADEGKLLLFASSDVDPGRFYLYEKATRKLEEVFEVRPELRDVAMGTMKPITFAAADGTKVPAYLTLPPGSSGKGLPAIVMPHGGPGSRDEWGFDWLAQFFAVRGYAVIQPNYRGSAGYGSDWYQKNGFQSWRTAIGDVTDAGRYLVKEGIAAPDKLAIVGWSYGGYAALQSSVLDPDLFKAIVAVAPVTDLERLRQESKDYTNFPQVDAFIGHGPHVREGSPAQNAGKIKAPVMLFHGDKDTNVGVGESRLMEDRLRSAGKTVTYVEFPGLDHQLASPQARARLLAESDAFLRKAMALPAN